MKKDKKITIAICLKESIVKKLRLEAEKQDVSLSALIENKISKK